MLLKAIQRQFLITFACMGAVLAYLPVLIEQRLASTTQVGLVMSTTGLAIILTPVLMTALADTRLQSRSIIAVLFSVSALTCFWQAASFSFTGLFISHAVFSFFFWPLAALQDGLVFADNQQARTEQRYETPYHRVRVFGTIGFALPLGVLYFLLSDKPVLGLAMGMDVSIALKIGGVLCALGAVNALTLPHVKLGQARRARFQSKNHNTETDRFPTRAAARVLFRGPALGFCICLFVAHLGNSAYYAFYPIYLTNEVGFADRWVGPITMLGVVLELVVMAGVGLMAGRLGLKRLLIVGLGFMVVRFALLGLAPTQGVAVWTQVLHGMTVVGIYVVPPIYLNSLASDHFRSSIHGLYAMTVFGPARIAGNILGGELADVSLPMLFNISALTTLLAVIGLVVVMRGPSTASSDSLDVPPMAEGD